MTPEATAYGTDAHPEVSEISDLTEGLLSVAHGRQVRTHLAECVLCAEVHDALTEIRSTLGTLPGPGRMPSDVTERIDAALVAEALLEAHRPEPVSRETAPTEPADVSRETGTPSAPASAPAPAPATGATRPAGRPSGATRPTSTGPGRGDTRRKRRLRTLLTTAGALGALIAGGAVFQALDTGPAGSPSAGWSAAQEQRAEDSALADDGLKHRVQALLEKQPAPVKSKPGLTSETEQPEATAPLVGGPTTVPSCVRAGIGRPEQPLAAEPGRPYSGRPSYLVVLPHPGDPQRVDAYVVDASCTKEAGSAPGEVLIQRTYARD